MLALVLSVIPIDRSGTHVQTISRFPTVLDLGTIENTSTITSSKGTIMFDRLRNRLDAGRQDGFTLIELLIVIVILGILAGIVVFAVGGITDRGKASACKSEKKTIQVAEEAYFAQNSVYVASASLSPGFLADAPTLYSAAPSGSTYAFTITAAGTAQGCT